MYETQKQKFLPVVVIRACKLQIFL